jgi:thioredoxin 1
MIVVKDFYADWCAPCRMMKPVIEELEKEGINVEKIDVDSNQSEAMKYGVRGIPTIVVEKDGQEVKRFVGYTSKEVLKETVESL